MDTTKTTMWTKQEQAMHRTQWIRALRSKLYKQGESYLRQDTADKKDQEYCCLGVACNISGLGKWNRFTVTEGLYEYTVEGKEGVEEITQAASSTLPQAVADWLGLAASRGDMVLNGVSTSLSILNDTDKLEFPEIAGIIEKEPGGLIKRGEND